MNLPDSLRLALSHELASIPQKQVVEAAARLSSRYRNHEPTSTGAFLHSSSDILAYAAVRFPATFAAIYAALAAVQARKPHWQPRRLLDAGAGPGTSMWAANELWPQLAEVTLLEREEAMITLGKHLATHAQSTALQQAQWQKVDLLAPWSSSPADLIIASYVLGELESTKREALINKLWSLTTDTFVIIEPGTPAGFSNIRAARQLLIFAGAKVVAPCPHALTCPMPVHDWCHFAQRVSRTSLHRAVKQVDLSYEDEKFSYIAVSRVPSLPIEGRVLRHPQIRPGHISLELCTPQGLTNTTITRKNKSAFRQTRDTHWGDSFHTTTDTKTE